MAQGCRLAAALFARGARSRRSDDDHRDRDDAARSLRSTDGIFDPEASELAVAELRELLFAIHGLWGLADWCPLDRRGARCAGVQRIGRFGLIELLHPRLGP